MKIAASVMAGCVVLCAGSVRAAEETAPEAGLTVKHLAFSVTGHMYLDGPALEAACPLGRPGAGRPDRDGNVWFGQGGGATVGVGGRCLVNGTGMIRPRFGNDYWTSAFPIDEGPASAMFAMTFSVGYNPYKETEFVWGAPMQGPGEGFILVSDGKVVRMVFKNPDKDNRWWFRRIIGGGETALPTTTGGSANALEAKCTIDSLQVMPGPRIIVYSKGGFYEYKDGNLDCLLGFDEYKDLEILPYSDYLRPPTMAVMGADGTFYLGTYFNGTGYAGKGPCVWRIVPGGQPEPWAWAVKSLHLDGPAMASGGHCGHHIWARQHNYEYLPPDFLVIMAHDESDMRRLRSGRISSLCADGKWREWEQGVPGAPARSPWFHTWAPGPNGTATSSSKATGHASRVTYLISGIDYDAPTTGDLLNPPIPPWPPAAPADSPEGGK